MKKIILVRHAKSSWKYQVKDHDRPLKKRGVNDAKLLSTYTNKMISTPELLWSSSANRALSTAKIFAKNWGIPMHEVKVKKELYDFSGSDLIKTIKECENTINSLMIFGHNFAITDFVNTFGNLYIENVPTCGFVVLEFDMVNWKELSKGKVVYKLFPKEIKNTKL